MEPLSEKKILETISNRLDGWSHEGDKLCRSYTFSDFREAIGFLVRIGFEAEEQMHHPEVSNVYNRVDIALTTHDAGNKVTEKDIRLAEAIEEIFKKN